MAARPAQRRRGTCRDREARNADRRLEPALVAGNSAEAVQFERQGYFVRDKDSAPGKPVFNRTVGLRDSYAKA